MAFDTFLKITGVEGEAMQANHAKEIEIYSFSWGASNPTTVGSGSAGLSAGKVTVSSFNLMKKSDKTSPILFAACCNGTHYDNATVTLNKATGTAGQAAFLVYTFTDVMIESVQWSGSTGGDDTPTESLSFAFAKVEIKYQSQDAKGAVGKPVLASWDLQKVTA
ncbi:MAG: Hcp family type VI secretion system effector [Gemmatimonadaceae bacterium]